MEGLFNLTESKIDSYYSMVKNEPQESVIGAIKVAVCQMPCMSRPICMLLDKILTGNPEYLEPVSNILTEDTEDAASSVSKMIYLFYLGASAVLEGVELSVLINPVSTVLQGVTKTILLPAVLSQVGTSEDFLNIFYCYAIIKNIDFYKAECYYRLRAFNHPTIIEAMLVEETLPAVSMALEMCKSPGFLVLLSKNINRFKERVKISSLIFLSFYRIKPVLNTGSYVCMTNEADIQALREMIDKETENFCLRIGSKARLNMLLGTSYADPKLPVMSHSEFTNGTFSTQKEFFEAFLAVSSPSVSHFFNYLEFYKDRFILNEQDQKLFLSELRKFHENNISYLEIVLPRLVKFHIIDGCLI